MTNQAHADPPNDWPHANRIESGEPCRVEMPPDNARGATLKSAGLFAASCCRGVGSFLVVGAVIAAGGTMWKRLVRDQVRRLGFDLVSFRSVSSLGSHLSKLIEMYDVGLVIDVGAHRGEYGHYLRELGYGGAIYSFEPVMENFNRLSSLAAGDERWHVCRSALGEAEGESELHIASGTVLSSFKSPSAWGRDEYGAGIETVRSEIVPVRRLDQLFEKVSSHAEGGAVMLKIDTQGFERDVILGASACLESVAVVQAELPVLHLYDEVADYRTVMGDLAAHGFEMSGFWPVAHDKSMRLIEVDYVAVRPLSGS